MIPYQALEDCSSLEDGIVYLARSKRLYLDCERVAYRCVKVYNKHIADPRDVCEPSHGTVNINRCDNVKNLETDILQTTGEYLSIYKISFESFENSPTFQGVMIISTKRDTGQDAESESGVGYCTERVQ
ncbi:hypothetical protein [Nocardia sp. CNY236]|uniref:hypothetical protein n=1 Tax=Nocardia sp. CNY236 TaxID=1169152 RepID=UPI00048F62CF|nr:hypothetical protein [Nocardia sp. CNY236]